MNVSVSIKKKVSFVQKETVSENDDPYILHQFDEIADSQIVSFRKLNDIFQSLFNDPVFLQIGSRRSGTGSSQLDGTITFLLNVIDLFERCQHLMDTGS